MADKQPRTHRIRQIHGLAGVTKAEIVRDEVIGQDVKVTDDDGLVSLAISTSSYPALLTPEQARYIGRQLFDAADRADAECPAS